MFYYVRSQYTPEGGQPESSAYWTCGQAATSLEEALDAGVAQLKPLLRALGKKKGPGRWNCECLPQEALKQAVSLVPVWQHAQKWMVSALDQQGAVLSTVDVWASAMEEAVQDGISQLEWRLAPICPQAVRVHSLPLPPKKSPAPVTLVPLQPQAAEKSVSPAPSQPAPAPVLATPIPIPTPGPVGPFTHDRVLPTPDGTGQWQLAILCPLAAFSLVYECCQHRTGQCISRGTRLITSTHTHPLYLLPHPALAGKALFFTWSEQWQAYCCSCSLDQQEEGCSHREALLGLFERVPILENLREGYWLFSEEGDMTRCSRLDVGYVWALLGKVSAPMSQWELRERREEESHQLVS